MKANSYRIKISLFIITAAFILVFSVPETCAAGQQLHQDGDIYCVIASDVEITTTELDEYRRDGSLENHILERSGPLIRILGTSPLEIYEGGFEEIGLQELEALQITSGSVDIPVSMYVKSQAHQEGGITITVTVIYDGPEEPDTPDVPDTPQGPDTPDTPEGPESPELPDTSDVSDTPDVPDTPDVSDTPNILNIPKVSDIPANLVRWPGIRAGSVQTVPERPAARKAPAASVGSGRALVDVTEQHKDRGGFGRTDAVLVGACVCAALAYGGVLGSDFRLIHWFNRRKKEGMKR